MSPLAAASALLFLLALPARASDAALPLDDECAVAGCGLNALQAKGKKLAAAKAKGVKSTRKKEPSWPRIANAGTSITSGYHASEGKSYPAQLQAMLGPGFLVENNGHNGAALISTATSCERWSSGSRCFFNFPEYEAVLEFKPDIVVLNFGTNDCKNCNWNETAFLSGYSKLIRVLDLLPSHPVIYLMIPPPVYRDGVYGGVNQTLVNTVLPKLITMIAEDHGLPQPIDIFGVFRAHCPDLNSQHCEWIGDASHEGSGEDTEHDDGVHPSDAGYRAIAKAVMDRILADARQ